jgi:hypothetical protein
MSRMYHAPQSQQTVMHACCAAGVNYGSGANGGVHIGSNSYITFGGGSSAYTGLGANNPARPSIHIGSQDNSWKQLWGGAANGCYRWVAEGMTTRTGHGSSADSTVAVTQPHSCRQHCGSHSATQRTYDLTMDNRTCCLRVIPACGPFHRKGVSAADRRIPVQLPLKSAGHLEPCTD